MGSTTSKIVDDAKKSADDGLKKASDQLDALHDFAKESTEHYKISILDPKFCQAQGFIEVDQVLAAISDVMVTTTTDASALQKGVDDLVDNAFSLNVAGFIKKGVGLALLALVGGASGSLNVKKIYILSMSIGAQKYPAVEVTNIFLLNKVLSYTGLITDSKSTLAYCAVHGSVPSGSLHRGTLASLMNGALELGKFKEGDYDEIYKKAYDIYCAPQPHARSVNFATAGSSAIMEPTLAAAIPSYDGYDPRKEKTEWYHSKH
jgi:hypothetical protein